VQSISPVKLDVPPHKKNSKEEVGIEITISKRFRVRICDKDKKQRIIGLFIGFDVLTKCEVAVKLVIIQIYFRLVWREEA